jgi:uncharacterized protein involved in response to NO
MAAWLAWVEQNLRGLGWESAWMAPPLWGHAHMTIWGTLTFYVFGFLGTAFPRWIDAPGPSPRLVGIWLLLLVAGQIAFVTGLLGAPHGLTAAGILQVGAFLSLLGFLGSALRSSSTLRRLQPRLAMLGVALGLVALGFATVGVATRDASLYQTGIHLGVRGYLFLLVVVVAQRLVPFFTARVLERPYAPRTPHALLAVLALVALRLPLVSPQPGSLLGGVAGALDVALALVLLLETRTWRPGAALRNPMISILYLGWGWIVLALLGSALAEFVSLLAPPLRIAVLHALTVGGFATLVIGMSTRVTLGHGGRPLVADGWLRSTFVLIQCAAVLRVVGPLGAFVGPSAPALAHWAALPWCAAFGIWLVRLVPTLARH